MLLRLTVQLVFFPANMTVTVKNILGKFRRTSRRRHSLRRKFRHSRTRYFIGRISVSTVFHSGCRECTIQVQQMKNLRYLLDRNKSTVVRQLKRNDKDYSLNKAQTRYRRRRKKSCASIPQSRLTTVKFFPPNGSKPCKNVSHNSKRRILS